ncbi:glutathione S-transferase C-terminal domain-containing protein [Acinetobacter puyangensis]|uniref:Putative glutathione S-transferase n=1 Tax=Acinetobacter puyangensis TaxID=1096779 RepID=A0A240E7K3_9GAMM|nr:glutathione S-transferase family protein [Acinetobacter puyangensis]SNX44602.1 putative glutathione S-transferase [Acinetobacter puyangensis]
MLVNGVWSANWHPVQATDQQGGFVRQSSSFRNWITVSGEAGPTGEAGFKAEANRYHLYVALICPWASRTLIARELKGLSSIISMSVVEPFLTDNGWQFGGFAGATLDQVNHTTFIHEIYTLADVHYTGRATVPILWDKQRQTIVNNESADILRMLNSGFGSLANTQYDLYPAHLATQIDAFNDSIYHRLNNGVYRAGFATTQQAYDEAVDDVFNTLQTLEQHFASHQFAMGQQFSESDIRLFVTLIRFDLAYYGLFKCNLKLLADYPHLSRYVQNILNIPGVAKTVNIEHIKQGYYSIKDLNPNAIVPKGPILNFQLIQTETLK